MPDDHLSDDELESLLRRTLSERAGQAPNSGMLEQRTLAAARRGPTRRDRPFWLMPVSVAASVLVIVGATVGGVALVNNLKSGKSHPVAASQTAPRTTPRAPSATTSATAIGPSPTVSAPRGTTQPDSSTTRAVQVSPVGGAVPRGFTVSDLTFVSADEGWALGTAPCTTKSCTSMVRTTDGGKSWRGIPAPIVGLQGADGCTSTCVSGVRFANPSVGYVFGSTVMYLTINGGSTWRLIPGGAAALEISQGNVLRVTSKAGCAPGCAYLVEMAAIGSTTWHTVLTANTPGTSTGAELVRAGSTAFVQVYGHTAGGGSTADSALYSSTDNGAQWTQRGEACPKLNGSTAEVDATALTPAPFGSVTVLCQPRLGGSLSYVTTSSDNGASFVPGSPFALATPIGAVSTSVVLAQSASGGQAANLLRSTDGGKTWAVVAKGGSITSKTSAGFLGFESKTTGRWVQAGDPTAVWTTHDAGAHWAKYTFSS